jgi:hypothetical protein
MGKQISEYLLYRLRYVMGYSLIGVTIITMIVVAGLYMPGGLSRPEMDSVVASNALSLSLASFNPATVIDLPYHILQRLSTDAFGISILSIKLPSLLLGLLSALGMLLLLRMWFKANVAVLTTILVITTGQFLFVAQNGTPSIVYIFWTIWLLVAALRVSRRAKWSGLWKIALFGIAALSLYTPLSIYILVALGSAVVLHPHLRYIVRRLSKVKLSLAVLCALVLAAPLAYAIARDPSVGLRLLGIPSQMPDFQANLFQLLRQYFSFATPSSSALMTPVYGLGPTILIFIGIFRLFTTKYTARSYIITAWIILLAPVLIVNPSFISVTFVPVVLLMAMGITTLLARWYQLFPRNPYARFAGLVPLAILIGGMVVSGLSRYMYGYLYDPTTTSNFSKDLRLVNHQLATNGQQKVAYVVAKDEVSFYSVIARHYPGMTVGTSVPPKRARPPVIVVSHAALDTVRSVVPQYVITDDTSHDANRFYVYKIHHK